MAARNQTYKNTSENSENINKENKGEKTLKCEICDLFLLDNSQRLKHMKQTHAEYVLNIRGQAPVSEGRGDRF